jgi:hypothetical protein
MKKFYFSRLPTVSVAVLFITSLSVTGTTLENYSQWSKSKHIIINTSELGYAIATDLAGFPYLVRLAKETFNFSEANGHGHDIRFSTAGGNPLAYEIEQWDSAGKKAAIWVKTDTIKGNNDSQYITMYWGNSGAADSSDAGAVFDTANGFLGVWHFNTAGTGSRPDATLNNDSAKAKGALFTQGGVIAGCDTFATDANAYDSVVGGIDLADKSFSIMAWSRLAAAALDSNISKTNRTIISQGKPSPDSGLHFGYHWQTGKYTFRFFSDDLDQSAVFSGGTGWHLITGTYNTTTKKQVLYLDSALDNSRNAHNYAGTGAVGIGAIVWSTGNIGDFFSGTIDEVVIADKVRSPDWIKLCYLTQKAAPDGLPTIKYPSRNISVVSGKPFTSIVPVTTGIIDRISLAPTELPLYLYFDSRTGTIAGFPFDTCTNAVYYVRAINSLGFAEDTISLSVGEQPVSVSGPRQQSAIPKLLGVRNSGAQRIFFSIPRINSVRDVTFLLYNSKGAVVWFSRMSGDNLPGGIQSIEINLKGCKTGNSGIYFLKMIATDSSGQSKLAGNATLPLFR